MMATLNEAFAGTGPEVTSTELGSGAVLSAHISGGQVNSSHLSTNLVYTGSPAAGGNSVQAGVATLGAGSSVWVVFGKAFKSAPYVTVSAVDDTLQDLRVGSPVTAGSCQVFGATASKDFHWIAVGSL